MEIDGGKPTVYPGDYDGYLYRKQLESDSRSASAAVNGKVVDASEYDWAKSGNSSPVNAQISADERRRRSLKEEARRLAKLVEDLSRSLAEREARISELDAAFSRPELYDDPNRIAASGKEYRALKAEVESLWGEWERLSVEAERVDGELVG